MSSWHLNKLKKHIKRTQSSQFNYYLKERHFKYLNLSKDGLFYASFNCHKSKKHLLRNNFIKKSAMTLKWGKFLQLNSPSFQLFPLYVNVCQ